MNIKHYCFILQHIIEKNYLNIYPIYQQVSECLMQKNDAGCGQVVPPPQQHFLDHEQISYNKHVSMVL